MKYPDYFEINLTEGLKAFLAEDPGKKRPFIYDHKKKNLFVIHFKMTNQDGRISRVYECVGFSKNWNGDRITSLKFRKVE